MAEDLIDEILWTPSARKTFKGIIEYLSKEWTEKEVQKFVDRTIAMLAMLKRYPEMCRPSLKRKDVRIGILNKHTQIVYHYKPGKKTNGNFIILEL